MLTVEGFTEEEDGPEATIGLSEPEAADSLEADADGDGRWSGADCELL